MNLGIAQQEWVGGLTILTGRLFLCSSLFVAPIVRIVSSDFVADEIFRL